MSAGDEIVQTSPEIGSALTPLDIAGCRKWVRMDVGSLAASFDTSARSLDFDSTMHRLMGAASFAPALEPGKAPSP